MMNILVCFSSGRLKEQRQIKICPMSIGVGDKVNPRPVVRPAQTPAIFHLSIPKAFLRLSLQSSAPYAQRLCQLRPISASL